MGEYTITVDGMMCRGCEATVRRALTALSGVSEVAPDAEADVVRVVGRPDAEERVRRTLEEIGYDPAE